MNCDLAFGAPQILRNLHPPTGTASRFPTDRHCDLFAFDDCHENSRTEVGPAMGENERTAFSTYARRGYSAVDLTAIRHVVNQTTRPTLFNFPECHVRVLALGTVATGVRPLNRIQSRG